MEDRVNFDYDKTCESGEIKVKIICLGDSAVGKSKLIERFLLDGFKPQHLSTYALTLYQYSCVIDKKNVLVDFWDTAGQEMFSKLHPSYYHQAHACILVFDATRKITYKNLSRWYDELREYRPEIPCICAINKIDADIEVTKRSFNFSKKHKLPFYYVSACDGRNVVKMFRDTIKMAMEYKDNSTDFIDEIMKELENFDLNNGSTNDSVNADDASSSSSDSGGKEQTTDS